jgi:alpha-1,2-mannosyltransferase
MDESITPTLAVWGYRTAALALIVVVVVRVAVAAVVSFIRTACFTPVPRGDGDTVVGFFHPYCDAGGGGERVLWCALQALAGAASSSHSGRPGRIRCVVYTGDRGRTPEEMLARAADLFGLVMPEGMSVQFVYLSTRHWLEASRYPRATLLGQSLGSMVVAWDACAQLTPHVWVDTMGAAFTFPIARLAGVSGVACYVHYPTVSTDMLARVADRRPDFNNDAAISGSAAATAGKLLYYRLFAVLYSWAGSYADAVMVNSKWTHAHIAAMWGLQGGARPVPAGGEASLVGWLLGAGAVGRTPDRVGTANVVYPPCNTDALRLLPLGGRKPVVVSVGQFRPEKDHALQLRAFAEFLGRYDKRWGGKGRAAARPRLLLIGGARDEGDRTRVAALRELAKRLDLSDGPEGDVEFVLNAPLPALRLHLASALVGLHTMWNEHFGIGVVEMMAAGVITIAHNSGGPREDIVVPWKGAKTGYLAATPSQYADALEAVWAEAEGAGGGDAPTLLAMAKAARESSVRFSDAEFRTALYANLVGVIAAVGLRPWRSRT